MSFRTRRFLAPYGKAAAGGGSFTTWDPTFHKDSGVSLSGGNLIATQTDAFAFDKFLGVASRSLGKFYYECTLTTKVSTNNTFLNAGIGNASANAGDSIGNNANSCGVNASGTVNINNSSIGTVTGSPNAVSGDTWCIFVDLTASPKLIWFRLNGGSWNAGGTADPDTGLGGFSLATLNAGPYFPAASFVTAGDVWTGDFGATTYAFTKPSTAGNW